MTVAIIRTIPQTAEASFITSWDDAINLHRALPKLCNQLEIDYGIDNLQMSFRNPWGGPSHTEFSLIVELAKGVTTATAAAVAKYLLDLGRDFLKAHEAKTKNSKGKGNQMARSRKVKKNRKRGKPRKRG